MLRDSTVAVVDVVRTRPRAIPLAMIHMRKSIHGFPFVPLYGYGAPLGQGGKRPGGETGCPLLGQCVMRRRTGTSAPSALPVQLMAAKNLLSTNRK